MNDPKHTERPEIIVWLKQVGYSDGSAMFEDAGSIPATSLQISLIVGIDRARVPADTSAAATGAAIELPSLTAILASRLRD